MKTLIALMIVVFFSLPVKALHEPTEVMALDFMTLVNSHRASLNLNPLIYSEEMELIAEAHARRMARKFLPFGHIGSKLRCLAVFSALKLNDNAYCSENVAMGQETAEEVFKSWMESPSHRAAIEDPRFTHSGLGFWRDFRGKLYWSEIFVEVL